MLGRLPPPRDGGPSILEVLEVPVHRIRLSELLDAVAAAVRDQRRLTVMYLNVHVVNASVRVPALREALHRADLVYCDGFGVRIGARLLGDTLPERMTGADLLWDVAAVAERRGLRVYWVGGSEGVAAAALERMRARYPALRVAGAEHGYFARQGPETEAVLERMRRARADVVLVGMGTPAQELWVAEHRDAMAAPVVWCVGAAADFVSGRVRRAPPWMHRHALEWVFRLLLEPRRMFGRYVIGIPLFLARVLWWRFRGRGASRVNLTRSGLPILGMGVDAQPQHPDANVVDGNPRAGHNRSS